MIIFIYTGNKFSIAFHPHYYSVSFILQRLALVSIVILYEKVQTWKPGLFGIFERTWMMLTDIAWTQRLALWSNITKWKCCGWLKRVTSRFIVRAMCQEISWPIEDNILLTYTLYTLYIIVHNKRQQDKSHVALVEWKKKKIIKKKL